MKQTTHKAVFPRTHIGLAAVVGLVLSLPFAGTALAKPPAELFEDTAPANARVTHPPKAIPGRTRAVTIKLNAIESDELSFALFDGARITVVKDKVVQNVNGQNSWVGHIKGEPDSEVVLTVHGKAMKGTITRGELGNFETYEVAFKDDKTHYIRQIDPDKKPPHVDPLPVSEAQMAAAAAANSTFGASPPSAAAPTGTVLDLLVVYSPQARINAGGADGIQAKIANAVTKANLAYQNSQINMQLNLVNMQEIAYTETGDMGAALTALQGNGDGKMDGVHALRDQYGADQVALITADANYCGIAYQMTSLGTWFAPWAFAVVHDDSRYNCLGGITLAHELGHNQGNSHDPQSSSYAGVYPYSYGYRVCGVFRDVMSYNCAGEPQINYFSNPNVSYNGAPTGISNAQDTALSMNNAAQTVASFRGSAVTSAPVAPSNLSAIAGSSSAINLSWSDNANNETGYKVQRSHDGINWTEIASLGSNIKTFSNSGLEAGTTYRYRVFAYNSIGNSGLSNVASATTNAAVIDTTAPTVTILSPFDGSKVSTTVLISVNASDNIAVSGLKLFIDGKQVSATNASSLSYKWNARKASRGSHSIQAEAADAAGNHGNQTISVNR